MILWFISSVVRPPFLQETYPPVISHAMESCSTNPEHGSSTGENGSGRFALSPLRGGKALTAALSSLSYSNSMCLSIHIQTYLIAQFSVSFYLWFFCGGIKWKRNRDRGRAVCEWPRWRVSPGSSFIWPLWVVLAFRYPG